MCSSQHHNQFLSPCHTSGVAFEQGKILPTPETVPFRLSRDIVDGMGITGVEGVFRRSGDGRKETTIVVVL